MKQLHDMSHITAKDKDYAKIAQQWAEKPIDELGNRIPVADIPKSAKPSIPHDRLQEMETQKRFMEKRNEMNMSDENTLDKAVENEVASNQQIEISAEEAPFLIADLMRKNEQLSAINAVVSARYEALKKKYEVLEAQFTTLSKQNAVSAEEADTPEN